MATAKLPQLTAKQVCQVFGISNMTLWSWRQGTRTLTPMPVATPSKATEGRATLRFNAAGIKAWAKKHGVVMVMTPEQALDDSAKEQSKPGPKQRVAS